MKNAFVVFLFLSFAICAAAQTDNSSLSSHAVFISTGKSGTTLSSPVTGGATKYVPTKNRGGLFSPALYSAPGIYRAEFYFADNISLSLNSPQVYFASVPITGNGTCPMGMMVTYMVGTELQLAEQGMFSSPREIEKQNMFGDLFRKEK